MFGYRLLRESDVDALLKSVHEQEARHLAELTAGGARERELYRELVEKTGELRAAQSRADLITARVNILEDENAKLRHALTPAIQPLVPSIGKRTVLGDAYAGAGAALFEDVGDHAAEQLRQEGLLNDPALDGAAMPAAAHLAPSFSE